MTSCKITQEGAEKCLILTQPCKNMLRIFTVLYKIVQKYLKLKNKRENNREIHPKPVYIYELLTNHHRFSRTEFLPLFKDEFILPTSRRAFGHDIYPCVMIFS